MGPKRGWLIVVALLGLAIAILIGPDIHLALQAQAQQNQQVYLPMVRNQKDTAMKRYNWYWPSTGTNAIYQEGNDYILFSRYTPGKKYIIVPVKDGGTFYDDEGFAALRRGVEQQNVGNGTLTVLNNGEGAPVSQKDVEEALVNAGISPQDAGIIAAGASAVMYAGLGTALAAVGVVLLAVGVGLLVAYLVIEAVEAYDNLEDVLPAPNTIGGDARMTAELLAWNADWMFGKERYHQMSMADVMGPDFAQPDPRDPNNDKCRYFRNMGDFGPNGRWPDERLELRITDRTTKRAEVQVWDRQTGERLAWGEAELYQGYGHRFIRVEPALQGNGVATALLNIMADVLSHANGQLGQIEFIVQDTNEFGQFAYSCLKSRATNVRYIKQNKWLQDQPAFIDEATRLGFPDYLGGAGSSAWMIHRRIFAVALASCWGRIQQMGRSIWWVSLTGS